MPTNILETLIADIARLMESAKDDYDQKRWDTHDYHVREFNSLLGKSKVAGIGVQILALEQAEFDEEIPVSWVEGTPYNPPMKQSVGSKTKKLREVINSADKLLRELSSRRTSEPVNPSPDFWHLLHPAISEVAKSRFEAGHYADSAETAFKFINEVVKAKVKSKTGREMDGASLMNHAFSPNAPVISLDDLSTESGKNIQQGFMQIFAGAMTGIRNPKAHGVITIDEERAIHFLYLASLLMHKLDGAT